MFSKFLHVGSRKYHQKLFLTFCMIISLFRPHLTKLSLCLLNSQPRPTRRTRFPPLPLFLYFTHAKLRGISIFLPTSSHFSLLRVASHYSLFCKSHLFFFLNHTPPPPLPYPFLFFQSELTNPTSFYPSREANPHNSSYMSLWIYSSRSF